MFSTGVEIFGGGTERTAVRRPQVPMRAPATVTHDGALGAAFDTVSKRRLVLKVRPGPVVAGDGYRAKQPPGLSIRHRTAWQRGSVPTSQTRGAGRRRTDSASGCRPRMDASC